MNFASVILKPLEAFEAFGSMSSVLGVAQRDGIGTWVWLESKEKGVQVVGTRTLNTDDVCAVVVDGIAASGCRNIAAVLWAENAAVGSLAPERVRGLSNRKLLHAGLAIAEQQGYDPKRDDVRLSRRGDQAIFAFGRADAITKLRQGVRKAGARLASLQLSSTALAHILPDEFEVAVFMQGTNYYLLMISDGPTRIRECESLNDVSEQLLEANRIGYISGHLTPIAALDDESHDRLGDTFEARPVKRFSVAQDLKGVGLVALGAGFGALSNA